MQCGPMKSEEYYTRLIKIEMAEFTFEDINNLYKENK